MADLMDHLMAVVTVAGQADELVELSHWLKQLTAVGGVPVLADELGELSRWLEQRMIVVEVTGLTAELSELSQCGAAGGRRRQQRADALAVVAVRTR